MTDPHNYNMGAVNRNQNTDTSKDREGVFHIPWKVLNAEDINADNISTCDSEKYFEEGDWQFGALVVLEKLREYTSENNYIYSTGYSGGITIFGWSGSGSVGIVVDSKGNLTMQYSKSWNVNSPDFNVSIQTKF